MKENVEGEILHELYSRKVIRIGNDKVIKSGLSLHAHEAATLRFIAENTTIPVPKVHDVQREDGKLKAIIMDYIPGRRLDHAWNDMSPDQKGSVANELHSYVSQLRNLKGDYIGAVDHGKAIIGNRFPTEGGPFESEKLFNEFILSDIVEKAPPLLKHYAKYALRDDHEVVFTHGDLAPRNIIIDEQCHVKAILDWEFGGWYPEHWEYIKALGDLFSVKDWPEYLPLILPPKYEIEYIGMSFLARISRS